MAGMDEYLPIAEHGLIGDLHSVALVGTDGTIDWYCCPRFDFARDSHEVALHEHGAVFRSRDMTMGLESTVPLKIVEQDAVSANFTLKENQTATFLLERVPEGFVPHHHDPEETRRIFDA